MVPLGSLEDLRAAVRAERRRRGLSQDQLAGMIGHSRKWLSDLERGATDPPVGMVLRVMALMGIPLHLGTGPSEPRPSAKTPHGTELEEEGL